ncbi:cupin domain-containing protein [Zhihengliuella salsuginis]|uniref:Cupin type-2 domain-containing protein n=1 Tax=Zhihengliuella salsuginis TaxID=578222 RepID=A0ABQ3GL65_9MICC|nr:cupin domain-containing protein [Zhihengliuella salsuginis]GHD10331.1 hypothetical protein GCM10008096_23780 [Zhihengliuella salsuginis]
MMERDAYAAFDHALHGGEGSTAIQFHFADAMTRPVAIQTWTLEPGASEGFHAHDDLEEFYLVLSGSARMDVDGVVYDLTPGESVLCAPGTGHDAANTGDGDLRMLVVWGRPGQADFSPYATYRKSVAARDLGPDEFTHLG